MYNIYFCILFSICLNHTPINSLFKSDTMSIEVIDENIKLITIIEQKINNSKINLKLKPYWKDRLQIGDSYLFNNKVTYMDSSFMVIEGTENTILLFFYEYPLFKLGIRKYPIYKKYTSQSISKIYFLDGKFMPLFGLAPIINTTKINDFHKIKNYTGVLCSYEKDFIVKFFYFKGFKIKKFEHITILDIKKYYSNYVQNNLNIYKQYTDAPHFLDHPLWEEY